MRVGIVGGGQLARMIALAGLPLGVRFTFLDPAPDACAAPLGTHLQGAYDDPTLLSRLAVESDVVTYEFENVPEAAVASLAGQVAVFPDAAALATARDRVNEKSLFRRLGLPTAGFHPVDTLAELERAVTEVGLPAVLKTRTLGYDGKGQAVLRGPGDLAGAWDRLGGGGLILESFVRFERELSVIAVRSRGGRVAFYPVAENVHRDGILHTSRCRPADPAQPEAERCARAVLEALDYVGVLTLELFQCGDRLLVNEMAPRVHNSGHWTIKGAATSQFENHLRAILDLPLGATLPRSHAAMVNFVGHMPATADVLAITDVHLHDYGKARRPGRKVGHATALAENPAALEGKLERLLAAL